MISAARLASGISLEVPPPLSSSGIELSTLAYSDGRLEAPSTNFSWDDIGDAVRELGFHVECVGQTDDGNSPALGIWLTEISSAQTGYVYAGGKGLSELGAMRTALGEFAERYIASHPPPSAAFLSSEIKLKKRGFFIPPIVAGGRDCYSPGLEHDWVIGSTINGSPAALPAEKAFYEYVPASGVRAFSWQHTAGLAVGRSLEEAIWAGLTECLERDAYWLVMRCKLSCPRLDACQLLAEWPQITASLEAANLVVVLKDCSLDWPLSIVHAAIVDPQQQLPAFSHGIGSALSIEEAALKAVLEALQIRFGLLRLVHQDSAASMFPAEGRSAARLWSDPASRGLIEHLLDDPKVIPEAKPSPSSATAAVSKIEREGHRIVYSRLGEFQGLQAVRVLVGNAVEPDPLNESIPSRMAHWLEKAGLRTPYREPILT